MPQPKRTKLVTTLALVNGLSDDCVEDSQHVQPAWTIFAGLLHEVQSHCRNCLVALRSTSYTVGSLFIHHLVAMRHHGLALEGATPKQSMRDGPGIASQMGHSSASWYTPRQHL
jgi:hypothetical protein